MVGKNEAPIYYTKFMPNTEDEAGGRGPIIQINKEREQLEDAKSCGFKNLYEQFLRGFNVDENHNCIGYRPIVDGVAQDYKFFTYKETNDMIKAIGSAMKGKDLIHENDDSDLKVSDGEHCRLVGIYSRTRYEWMLAEYSCYYTNCAVVTLYDSLGPESSGYIFKITNIETVFVGGENEIKNIIGIADQSKDIKIKNIITFDKVDDSLIEECKKHNFVVYTLDEMIEFGKEHLVEPSNTQYDDICTICFTSGTTATPKGVILSHGAFMSLNLSIDNFYTCRCKPTDRYLAYLPLAHVFERFIEGNCFSNGSEVAYYQGDIKKIVDDLKAVRPTIFCGVPRLFNRIYNILKNNIEKLSPFKKWIFDFAYNSKLSNLAYNKVAHAFYDKFLFKPVAAKVGFDNIRWFLSGSAPLADDISQFFKIIFSAPVMNGYGMTEGCGGCVCSCDLDYSTVGHSGTPVDSLSIRLCNVPEKNYSYKDTEHKVSNNDDSDNTPIEIMGRGEVLMKGYSVFKGYYKEDALNRQVFDHDGWFHTGDIGYIRKDNGALQIIDRIKNIFKLSQGEYISVEKIENIYLLNSLIEQIFIYGDSYQSYIVGVIVPNKNAVLNLLISNNLIKDEAEANDFIELCKKKEIRKCILDAINKTAIDNGLFSFERMKNVYVETEPWSVENNFLTPSLKLKRNLTTEKYHGDIAIMYKEGQL